MQKQLKITWQSTIQQDVIIFYKKINHETKHTSTIYKEKSGTPKHGNVIMKYIFPNNPLWNIQAYLPSGLEVKLAAQWKRQKSSCRGGTLPSHKFLKLRTGKVKAGPVCICHRFVLWRTQVCKKCCHLIKRSSSNSFVIPRYRKLLRKKVAVQI